MRLVAVAVVVAVVAGGCTEDPKKAVEDAVFEKLTCEEIARPSTLARIRALLEQPSADTAGAVLLNPQDLATIVSIAGPEAEAGVVVTRNVLDLAPATHDLLQHGWDGVQCGEPVTLDCTAGDESVAVLCASGSADRIDVVLDKCTLGGSVYDGSLTVTREKDGARANFAALSINETKVIDGDVRLALGGASGFDAEVRAGDGLRVVDFGGPTGGLECGEELRVDTLAFTDDDDVAKVELKGFHETTEETYGVATFGNHLSFDGSCACPLPGSGVVVDLPRPVGKEGTAHARVSYGDADDDKACAKASVSLEDWPSSCTGLGDDCGRAATEATLGGLLSAFCVTR